MNLRKKKRIYIGIGLGGKGVCSIEDEVDAGKFKQNDNVCFACHKDDSIREIDITGDGGYMLYGIKYNMDVDSVRTILSKSDIWTIQKDQTDTIFCKDKTNTYYFDISLRSFLYNLNCKGS